MQYQCRITRRLLIAHLAPICPTHTQLVAAGSWVRGLALLFWWSDSWPVYTELFKKMGPVSKVYWFQLFLKHPVACPQSRLKQVRRHPSLLQHPQFHQLPPHHRRGSKTGKYCTSKAELAALATVACWLQQQERKSSRGEPVVCTEQSLKMQLQLLPKHQWTLSG